MKSLRDLIIKKQAAASFDLDDKTIFYIFKKVIKDEFGNIGTQKFSFDFFKNKTLFVKSESSVWSAELWSNKGKLIKKINDELGNEAVCKIKIK